MQAIDHPIKPFALLLTASATDKCLPFLSWSPFLSVYPPVLGVTSNPRGVHFQRLSGDVCVWRSVSSDSIASLFVFASGRDAWFVLSPRVFVPVISRGWCARTFALQCFGLFRFIPHQVREPFSLGHNRN